MEQSQMIRKQVGILFKIEPDPAMSGFGIAPWTVSMMANLEGGTPMGKRAQAPSTTGAFVFGADKQESAYDEQPV